MSGPSIRAGAQASFELDLFPGSRIVPYLAYDRNSGHGRGIETWVQGANNEFAVPYTLRDSTNNYRGGVRFEFNRFHVTLEQGGTTFKEDDSTLYTGPNPGDRTTPINGSSDVAEQPATRLTAFAAPASTAALW